MLIIPYFIDCGISRKGDPGLLAQIAPHYDGSERRAGVM